jgi:hypothetical protein
VCILAQGWSPTTHKEKKKNHETNRQIPVCEAKTQSMLVIVLHSLFINDGGSIRTIAPP